VKDAFYRTVARWLSRDDIRRAVSNILKRTAVSSLIVETAEGRFAVDPRDSIISWSLINKGTWEPDESRVLAALVDDGDTVIDVGAHVGWYTILFANRAGEHGRVLSFEPAPSTFPLLKLNVQLNAKRNVELHTVALSDRSGEMPFVVHPENFGDHHVAFASGEQATVHVACARLDEYAGEFDAIKLIKLDCQGAEPAILAGASRALARCRYLATEYWPAGLRRAGFDPSAYVAALAECFAEFRRVGEDADAAFRPIAELASDAARVTDSADYLLSSSLSSRA